MYIYGVLAKVYIVTLLKRSDIYLLGQQRIYSLTDKVINKICDFAVAAKNPVDLLQPWWLVFVRWWRNTQAAVKMSLGRGTPGCGLGHAAAYKENTYVHPSYVIFSLSEKIMAGHIHYPNTYSAIRSGTHRQKSFLLSQRRRGGNQGKWGMLPPAPTSLIAGWYSWGMKECQVAMGHVVCFALLWYAYPLSCYELIWCCVLET